MKRWILTLLGCLGILALTAVALVVLRFAKPAAEQMEKVGRLPNVEVLTANPENIPLRLPTQGMVEAAHVTQLAAEVAGQVTWVSPKFQAGGRFAPGEELLRLEPSDYEAALADARAGLADASLNLLTEEARVEQALRDWKRLGAAEPATALTLRKPHLESAQARKEAARAAVESAERNLTRTRLLAPFPSTVDRIHTDLGSYLAPGTSVATLLADAPYEVRLPLSLDDYTLAQPPDASSPTTVFFRTQAGGRDYAWEGKVVREEGKIERSSRSLFLVAEVSPRDGNDRVLQPGLFVQAEVEGRHLQNVYRIPLRAFHNEDQLVLIGSSDRVEFRDVSVLRRDGDIAIVSQGLNPGDRVCLTALDVFLDGMKVLPRAVTQVERTTPIP